MICSAELPPEPEPELCITSIPLVLGFSTEPGMKLTRRLPLVTVTGKVFCTAMFIPPAAA